jgi:hypothetical protein
VAKNFLILGIGLYAINADLEYAHFAYRSTAVNIPKEDTSVVDVHSDR